MKRFWLGLLFSLAGVASAAAADLIQPPVYNWTGFYIGANAGAAFGEFAPRTSAAYSGFGYFATTSIPAIAAVGAQTIDPTGFTGGIEAGYNMQSGSFVFGLESDFDYFGLRGSATNSGVYPCCGPTGFTVNSSARTSGLFTLRPRIGIAHDNLLFYATGGLAVTNISGSFSFSDNFANASESAAVSQTKTGYAVGAGVEAGLWTNWTVKAEYLYVDFGRLSTTSTNLTTGGGFLLWPENQFTHSIRLSASIARVGLNYHF
ncbi:MAG TPA: outer membrane beta-barrel protein [Beijerinckiaceae bacterium]|nr:outer membrane beta-barrel protein [Beijerinckiaceae bacterium]